MSQALLAWRLRALNIILYFLIKETERGSLERCLRTALKRSALKAVLPPPLLPRLPHEPYERLRTQKVLKNKKSSSDGWTPPLEPFIRPLIAAQE